MEEFHSPQDTTTERAQAIISEVHELLQGERFEQAFGLFSELDPADQGEIIAELSDEQRLKLIEALPPEGSAKILPHLEPEEAAEVVENISAPELADILDEARPDVAADILRQLPENRSQEALAGMEEYEEVIPLLEYADDSAGGLMTPEFLTVREDLTTGTALDSVRIQGEAAENIASLFVVDADGKLVGTVGVTRIALARQTRLVRDITDPEVISVTPETDREECARLMERYDLRSLPVEDQEGRMLGVILIEDVVDVLDQEATEDMYKMAGIGGERLFGSLQGSIRRRLPWLYLNLATTIMAASVISLFESTIAKLVTLAVFLPVVAGQGGIGGTQTLTLVIRNMALGDVPARRGFRLLAREVYLGLIHGVLLGVAVALIAFAWKGNLMLGVVVGIAMAVNMLVAGVAGAAVPLLLRLLRTDPAVGSAVIVTTITDVVGFLLFLGIAAGLISYLV